MGLIHMSFLSKRLGMMTDVNIILPTYSRGDGIKNRDPYVPGMKFQVMWLLHGGSGDYNDYLKYTMIQLYAEEHQVAVVMPSAYNSQYRNHPTSAEYLYFISEELPEMCRAMFPFSDKREDNFIGGFSMGSIGAYRIAMMRPERYSHALIMSGGGGTVGGPKAEFMMEYIKKNGGIRLGGPVPEDTGEAGTETDTLFMAEQNVKNGKPLPKMIFAVGTKDFVLESTRRAAAHSKELGYDVHLEEVEGYGHEWRFWDRMVEKAMTDWFPLRHDAIFPE